MRFHQSVYSKRYITSCKLYNEGVKNYTMLHLKLSVPPYLGCIWLQYLEKNIHPKERAGDRTLESMCLWSLKGCEFGMIDDLRF